MPVDFLKVMMVMSTLAAIVLYFRVLLIQSELKTVRNRLSEAQVDVMRYRADVRELVETERRLREKLKVSDDEPLIGAVKDVMRRLAFYQVRARTAMNSLDPTYPAPDVDETGIAKVRCEIQPPNF